MLNPKLFFNLKLDLVCFICIHYLKFDEYADSHLCKNKDTCLKCYSNCKKEANFSIQYTECNIIFKSSVCFQKHLFNKFFKNKKSIKVNPYQKYFFVIHVIKMSQDFFVEKNKVVLNNCQKSYCAHYRKYLDEQHKCHIKHLEV